MGKYDDVMYRYLSDNDRFADLFNAVLFDGRAVVQGELLEDASERCVDVVSDAISQAETREGRIRHEKSIRDIRKRMRTGECLIVTAIENQAAIDYAMPWRIMRYDQMEYGRQIRDMMRFGKETEVWQDLFHDYGMTLFCAGERNDLSRFGTDLKLLLEVLQLRQDKEGLLTLWSGELFSHIDLETAETMAVMTDSVDILKKLEITEEGGCNMCLAVEEMRRDWMAEGRAEGKAEGEAKGIIEIGIEFGLSENDILTRLQNKLDVSLQAAQEYLRMFGKMTV